MPRIPLFAKLLLSLFGADLISIIATPLILKPRPSDLAVVFGNAVTAEGAPSPRLKARLDEALTMYRAGLVGRILVSGGVEPGPETHSEPAIMAAYLEAHGVPSALLQDAEGQNTAATAVNTARLRPPLYHVLVVTQWFHVARATLAMRQQGISQVAAAWPLFFEWRDLYSLTRETVALPMYVFKAFWKAPNVAVGSKDQFLRYKEEGRRPQAQFA